MPSIHVCDVIGDGLTPETAHRPDLPTDTQYACLMIHEAKAKALIYSAADVITHPGVASLISASTSAGLRQLAATTSPNAPRRAQINTWLTNNGYQTITAGMTWGEAIQFIARQVNPAADLDATSTGG